MARTASNGHGQVAAVVGEAGVGKSRLVYEFTLSHRQQIPRAPGGLQLQPADHISDRGPGGSPGLAVRLTIKNDLEVAAARRLKPCFNGAQTTLIARILEYPAVTAALDFKPGFIAVSAGFDTYKECPIAQLRLDKGTYRRIGKMIAETDIPRFAVLESGYTEDLPILAENFLDGFFR